MLMKAMDYVFVLPLVIFVASVLILVSFLPEQNESISFQQKSISFAEEHSNYNANHLLFQSNDIRPDNCKYGNEISLNKKYISTDVWFKMNFSIGDSESKQMQLCFAQTDQQYKLVVEIENESTVSDCDIFLSARCVQPDKINHKWDWKSDSIGDDRIIIPTYLNEFREQDWRTLYISVHGKSIFNTCRLRLMVSAIDPKELLQKVGLRGGRVLLPRDVQALLGTS